MINKILALKALGNKLAIALDPSQSVIQAPGKPTNFVLPAGRGDIADYIREGSDLGIGMMDGRMVSVKDFFRSGATSNHIVLSTREGHWKADISSAIGDIHNRITSHEVQYKPVNAGNSSAAFREFLTKLVEGNRENREISAGSEVLPVAPVIPTPNPDPIAPPVVKVAPSVGTVMHDVLADTAANATPTLKGSAATPGSKIYIMVDDRAPAVAMADGNGDWSFTADASFANGHHAVTLVAEDATGARSNPSYVSFEVAAPVRVSVEIVQLADDVAPVTGHIANGGATNDLSPTLSGSLSVSLNAGDLVEILRDGVVVGTASVDGTTWTFTDSGLSDLTTYTYTAHVKDAAGNIVSPYSNMWKVTADTNIGEQNIVIAGVTDDVGSVTGAVANEGTTDDTTPTLHGTLALPLSASETLYVFRNGDKIGEASVNGTTWTFTDGDNGVHFGTHTYTAHIMTAEGYTSPASNTWTITVSVPAATTVYAEILEIVDDAGSVTGHIANGGSTDDTTPTLQGMLSSPLEAGMTVEVLRDGHVVGAATVSGLSWMFTDHVDVPKFAAGLGSSASYNIPASYTVRVVGSDGVIGAESAAYTVTITGEAHPPVAQATIDTIIDDAGPVVGLVANGGVTDDDTPTLQGTLFSPLEAGMTVEVLRAGHVVGTATVSGLSWIFTDHVDVPKFAPGQDASASYNFPVSYTVRIVGSDGIVGAESAAYHVTITGEAHPPVAQAITIDTIIDDVGPVTGHIANGGVTDDLSPTLSGSLSSALHDGDKVEILKDGQVIGIADVEGTNWTFTDSTGMYAASPYPAFTSSYTARVVSSDGGAGPESAVYTVTFDVQMPNPFPQVTVTALVDDAGPVTGHVVNGGLTDDTTPLLQGSLSFPLTGDDYTVQVYRDGVAIGTASVSGTAWMYQDTGLENGANYSYTVWVVDAGGKMGGGSEPYVVTVSASPVDPHAGIPVVTISAVIDDVAPLTGSVVHAGATDDTAPIVTGLISRELSEGETVHIFRNGVDIGTASVSGTSWTFQDDGLENGGTYSYKAAVIAPHGQGPISDQWVITVQDDSVPTAITLTVIDNDEPYKINELRDGGITDDSTPALSGLLSVALAEGETLHIFRNGKDIGTASVNVVLWSYEDSGLEDGEVYTYQAKIIDAHGNERSTSDSLSVTFEAPSVERSVQILEVLDDVGLIMGSVANGGVTNDWTPTLSGSLSAPLNAGEMVEILDGGHVIGTASVTGTAWMFTDALVLIDEFPYPDVSKDYSVRVVTSEGVTLAESGIHTVNFDVQAPTQVIEISTVLTVTGLSHGNEVLSYAEMAPSGTISSALEDGEVIHVYRNGADIGTATVYGLNWVFHDQGLNDGMTCNYEARIVDAVGNEGALSNSFKQETHFDYMVGSAHAVEAHPAANDTLVFALQDEHDATGGNGHLTLNDFIVGGRDAPNAASQIDISQLLVGYKADSGDKIMEYLSASKTGDSTVINIDRDGAGGAFQPTALVTPNNVDTSIETLLANHQIIIG